MRKSTRNLFVLLALIIALSALLPPALSAAHHFAVHRSIVNRAAVCAGRGHCDTCRVLESALLLQKLLLPAALLIALFKGLLIAHAGAMFRGAARVAPSPVACKVRMNN